MNGGARTLPASTSPPQLPSGFAHDPASGTTTATLVVPPVERCSCNAACCLSPMRPHEGALRDINLEPGYTLADAPLLTLLSRTRFQVLRFMDGLDRD
jgi:hypothetical protein